MLLEIQHIRISVDEADYLAAPSARTFAQPLERASGHRVDLTPPFGR